MYPPSEFLEQCEGGPDDDVVLFTGSGTTAAIAKVISALSLDKQQSSFGIKRGSRYVHGHCFFV